MRMVNLLPGWITLILSVIFFSDVVGSIRAKVYKERTVGAETRRRQLWIKLVLIICFAFIFLSMNQ